MKQLFKKILLVAFMCAVSLPPNLHAEDDKDESGEGEGESPAGGNPGSIAPIQAENVSKKTKANSDKLQEINQLEASITKAKEELSTLKTPEAIAAQNKNIEAMTEKILTAKVDQKKAEFDALSTLLEGEDPNKPENQPRQSQKWALLAELNDLIDERAAFETKKAKQELDEIDAQQAARDAKYAAEEAGKTRISDEEAFAILAEFDDRNTTKSLYKARYTDENLKTNGFDSLAEFQTAVQMAEMKKDPIIQAEIGKRESAQLSTQTARLAQIESEEKTAQDKLALINQQLEQQSSNLDKNLKDVNANPSGGGGTGVIGHLLHQSDHLKARERAAKAEDKMSGLRESLADVLKSSNSMYNEKNRLINEIAREKEKIVLQVLREKIRDPNYKIPEVIVPPMIKANNEKAELSNPDRNALIEVRSTREAAKGALKDGYTAPDPYWKK